MSGAVALGGQRINRTRRKMHFKNIFKPFRRGKFVLVVSDSIFGSLLPRETKELYLAILA